MTHIPPHARSITRLSGIHGIGAVTVDKLLLRFKSVKKFRETEDHILEEIFNRKQFAALLDYFQ